MLDPKQLAGVLAAAQNTPHEPPLQPRTKPTGTETKTSPPPTHSSAGNSSTVDSPTAASAASEAGTARVSKRTSRDEEQELQQAQGARAPKGKRAKQQGPSPKSVKSDKNKAEDTPKSLKKIESSPPGRKKPGPKPKKALNLEDDDRQAKSPSPTKKGAESINTFAVGLTSGLNCAGSVRAACLKYKAMLDADETINRSADLTRDKLKEQQSNGTLKFRMIIPPPNKIQTDEGEYELSKDGKIAWGSDAFYQEMTNVLSQSLNEDKLCLMLCIENVTPKKFVLSTHHDAKQTPKETVPSVTKQEIKQGVAPIGSIVLAPKLAKQFYETYGQKFLADTDTVMSDSEDSSVASCDDDDDGISAVEREDTPNPALAALAEAANDLLEKRKQAPGQEETEEPLAETATEEMQDEIASPASLEEQGEQEENSDEQEEAPQDPPQASMQDQQFWPARPAPIPAGSAFLPPSQPALSNSGLPPSGGYSHNDYPAAAAAPWQLPQQPLGPHVQVAGPPPPFVYVHGYGLVPTVQPQYLQQQHSGLTFFSQGPALAVPPPGPGAPMLPPVILPQHIQQPPATTAPFYTGQPGQPSPALFQQATPPQTSPQSSAPPSNPNTNLGAPNGMLPRQGNGA